MQKITPFLWFDNQAEEAAKFYCSIFKDSKINSHSDMIVDFELEGTNFTALNGGPQYTFNEAVSFVIHCDTQTEVDYYWEKLTDGGEEGRCGWLKDKFGVSWQVVPTGLGSLIGNPDKEKSGRAMNAMLQMKKIVIADLEKASNGK